MSAAHANENSRSCKNCPAWPKSAFAELTESELEFLQKNKKEIARQRGEPFSIKAQPTDSVYCLREGGAKITLADSTSGRESIVRLAGAGDLLGYRCIFSEATFRGTANALGPSVACQVARDSIFELLASNPKFSLELLRRMGKEVASAEYHHHSFCQKNVRERLAEGLLLLEKKFGEDSAWGRKINIRLTRIELSSWIGASRETVIRELTCMINESLLQQRDDYLYILDCNRLEQASGSVTRDNPPPAPPAP